ASRSLLYTDPADLPVPAFTIQPTTGNAYALTLDVTLDEAEAAPLRFNQFYFPGWEARLDGTRQDAYPSTNVGLLTVDVPPGRHILSLAWTGTMLQRVAGVSSMVTLVLLAALAWWHGRRGMAIIPLLLLVLALVATFSRPAIATIT